MVPGQLPALRDSIRSVAERALGSAAPDCFLPTQERARRRGRLGVASIHLIYEKCDSPSDAGILLHLVMSHCG